jgi:hypothetical protein
MRGLSEHPGGSRRLRGAEMSGSPLRYRHFKCHIECDACLLDPRLIDRLYQSLLASVMSATTNRAMRARSEMVSVMSRVAGTLKSNKIGR